MYRYRHERKPQKVTLDRYPDLTLKAARDKRDELAAWWWWTVSCTGKECSTRGTCRRSHDAQY